MKGFCLKISFWIGFVGSILTSCTNSELKDLPVQDSEGQKIEGGVVLQQVFNSSSLNRDWRYSIYLPSDYGKDSFQYDVLYLLHGHGGNETVWMSSGEVKAMIDTLISSKLIQPLIIVMPDGGNSWFVDGHEKMESAIIKELIPLIEANYRINKNWEHRIIGGMSAGGYGSLRFILKYPELFQTAILMSPASYLPFPDQISYSRKEVQSFKDNNGEFSNALWNQYNYPNYWSTFDECDYFPHRFYISTGSSDVFKGIIKSVNEQLPEQFNKRKTKVYYEVKNYLGGHEMSVWKQALKDALLKIYSKSDTL